MWKFIINVLGKICWWKITALYIYADRMQVNVGNWTGKFPLEFFLALLVSHNLNQEIVAHAFVICYECSGTCLCLRPYAFTRACFYTAFIFTPPFIFVHKLVSTLNVNLNQDLVTFNRHIQSGYHLFDMGRRTSTSPFCLFYCNGFGHLAFGEDKRKYNFASNAF